MLFDQITETRRAWSGPLRAPFKDAPFCHNYMRHPVSRQLSICVKIRKSSRAFQLTSLSQTTSQVLIRCPKINNVVFNLWKFQDTASAHSFMIWKHGTLHISVRTFLHICNQPETKPPLPLEKICKVNWNIWSVTDEIKIKDLKLETRNKAIAITR